MENNGLNINRPLLSVRRFSSISSSLKNENRKKESHLPIKSSIESCKNESSSDPMMNSGSVPFGWEHSPGRPKNKQIQTMENPPILPKLPPGRFLKPKSESVDSTKKESSDSRDDDDDDNDEAFMDALDTLSRGETSYYNCSASGVSGFGSDVKPSGFLRADPKMREFMINRFLPAAKAMASDVPQHTFKKTAVKEKPQEVKKLMKMDNNNNKIQLRYGPNFLQDVAQDKQEEDDSDNDYDYDFHEHENKSSKFCGLIPRFYSVTPVHGMCMRAKLPISPASRTQASSSSSSSFRETDAEPARNAIYKHRSLNNGLKIESTETTNLEGSKLYNRLQGHGISVSLSGSFQSTASEQSNSSSKKKGISFKELLADNNTDEITETDSQDSIIEKTLYVDTVHIVKSPKENPCPSCLQPQSSSSLNESLEFDMLADEAKRDMKTKKYKYPEIEFGFELFDDAKGDQKLKDSEFRVFEHPAPPPLPKSPSDSWLCRTLPSVSSKNAPMRWNPKSPYSDTVANDQKCEKTDESIGLQSPQGPLNPIPES